MISDKLIFEKSREGKEGVSLPESSFDLNEYTDELPFDMMRNTEALLPEVSEPELIRHYTILSRKNFSVDTNFYPLGSCTMKYNPKVNEEVAALDGFASLHPLADESCSQGTLELMYCLDRSLCELTGMDAFTLQPAAGAHGELTGMMLVKAYHAAKGDHNRNKVIVPDSSHGTNPATAAMYGYEVVQVPSNVSGRVDIEALKEAVNDDCACLMLTNPNTLGIFEKDILEIASIIHDRGGLLYYDGANMNAMMGLCRPGDMGFDIVHLNVHKTLSTPHGGGGPGAGPVGVKSRLMEFLPAPIVQEKEGVYSLFTPENTIGKVKAFYGNIGVLIKAYAYILSLGAKGLKHASEDAVLNANYLRVALQPFLDVPHNEICMHEFVASCQSLKEKTGVSALDVAKRLLDHGIHAPTVYFPLIVSEALMIEPTETESKEMLDEFVSIIKCIVDEAGDNPEAVKHAPQITSRTRVDEVLAARKPDLNYYKK